MMSREEVRHWKNNMRRIAMIYCPYRKAHQGFTQVRIVEKINPFRPKDFIYRDIGVIFWGPAKVQTVDYGEWQLHSFDDLLGGIKYGKRPLYEPYHISDWNVTKTALLDRERSERFKAQKNKK